MRGVIVSRASENDQYAVEVARGEFVYEGGLSPIVNHSCDPTCGVRRNDLGALDLVARRLIAPHDEITVDYAMHSYVIEHFPRRCLCGSAICRGEVRGWRDLPHARKVIYAGWIAPFLAEAEREPVSA